MHSADGSPFKQPSGSSVRAVDLAKKSFGLGLLTVSRSDLGADSYYGGISLLVLLVFVGVISKYRRGYEKKEQKTRITSCIRLQCV